MMKQNRLAMGFVLVTFVLSIGASALAKGAHRLKLSINASIAGTAIGAGEYKVETTDQNSAVKVTFIQGKNSVATAEGKLVDRGGKFSTSSVVYGEDGKGALRITELRLAGMSQAIVFEN